MCACHCRRRPRCGSPRGQPPRSRLCDGVGASAAGAAAASQAPGARAAGMRSGGEGVVQEPTLQGWVCPWCISLHVLPWQAIEPSVAVTSLAGLHPLCLLPPPSHCTRDALMPSRPPCLPRPTGGCCCDVCAAGRRPLARGTHNSFPSAYYTLPSLQAGFVAMFAQQDGARSHAALAASWPEVLSDGAVGRVPSSWSSRWAGSFYGQFPLQKSRVARGGRVAGGHFRSARARMRKAPA